MVRSKRLIVFHCEFQKWEFTLSSHIFAVTFRIPTSTDNKRPPSARGRWGSCCHCSRTIHLKFFNHPHSGETFSIKQFRNHNGTSVIYMFPPLRKSIYWTNNESMLLPVLMYINSMTSIFFMLWCPPGWNGRNWWNWESSTSSLSFVCVLPPLDFQKLEPLV